MIRRVSEKKMVHLESLGDGCREEEFFTLLKGARKWDVKLCAYMHASVPVCVHYDSILFICL